MEDQEIGKVCEICHRRDYVPFKCKKCHRILCDQHFWDEEHQCRLQYDPPKAKLKNTKEVHFCDECKCKLFTVNHYYCDKCEKLYCLKHRIPEEHRCEDKKDKCQLI